MSGHSGLQPSAWVTRWAHLVQPAGRVLDVAAGSGRHARWFAARGHAVTAVDRDEAALATLPPDIRTLAADLEGDPWPLGAATFDAVVVTNYLWRPLFASLRDAVADGGLLVVETFGVGQASVGKPSNPAFLLAPGELISLVQGLRIVAYEDGFLDTPARFVQRIAAVREAGGAASPARHPLRKAGVPGSLESIDSGETA